ncbi:SPARC-like [Paramacrobiotus metropolitanus]|uniref:SPARC-like n=1 Tax=Paramacrobiotus metropolitanus TaxID=2943436 RepID=UPI002445BCCB|nr:SPARC-like [Paramacrobiotus metropolitanus]XP_055346430.1 SPARC-like [Paramacrobiotus metropolitanus]
MWRFVLHLLVVSFCLLGTTASQKSKKGPHHRQVPVDAGTMSNGIPDADPIIAERVVAKKNPNTGEIELNEEKMLLNVDDPGENTGATAAQEDDEVDDSMKSDGSSRTNPCANFPCEEGLECELNEDEQPMCVCSKMCPNNSPIKVCSSFNQTFDSECHLYKQRCLCQRGLPGCDDPKNKDMQLEYLNECRELALCTPDDMADFPRRMGDWLFQIMKELAKRNELAPQYRKYEKRSEKKYQPGQPLPHPILWKFCDLDKLPSDRYISRKELMPIRAPLIPMEHCIAPFLDDCDTDNDHKLTLAEWGRCLKLAESEVEDICSQAMQLSQKKPRSADPNAPSSNDDEFDE